MKENLLFKNISPMAAQTMLGCFKPEIRKFSKGETVLVYSNALEHLCLILKGSAHLYSMDSEGEYSFLEHYTANDVFGEVFSVPVGNLGCAVQADSRCEVMFIRFDCVNKRCTRACQSHNQLIFNLFELTALRSRKLTERLSILGHRSLRGKLTAYLEQLCQQQGTKEIELELSYSRLADYLCADRSSMMRELKNMADEGLITRKGKRLTFLNYTT